MSISEASFYNSKCLNLSKRTRINITPFGNFNLLMAFGAFNSLICPAPENIAVIDSKLLWLPLASTHITFSKSIKQNNYFYFEAYHKWSEMKTGYAVRKTKLEWERNSASEKVYTFSKPNKIQSSDQSYVSQVSLEGLES